MSASLPLVMRGQSRELVKRKTGIFRVGGSVSKWCDRLFLTILVKGYIGSGVQLSLAM
ncbi:MAG: hypothetical protein P5681_24105 [Limnospira sp. PMC 894.15]|uniref:hypothetical protein n=1 Tax=Limnospira sp. PMC 894.15 TaxID=2981100 RepID=UPI0028E17B8C|nr:hypothetical protein [Limnospira sp. PMC 894.15]MDT9190846.1 hypothetical protein [Limnospira sp. PMC 894.15]